MSQVETPEIKRTTLLRKPDSSGRRHFLLYEGEYDVTTPAQLVGTLDDTGTVSEILDPQQPHMKPHLSPKELQQIQDDIQAGLDFEKNNSSS